MKTQRGPGAGFTLIELTVTLAVLAVTMALAMPSFQAWIQNTRIRNTAESILNGLQTARNEAVRRNASVQFVLGAGSSWTYGCVVTTPGCPNLDPIQSRSAGEGSGSSIRVVPNLGNTVVFNSFGAMTTPAPAAGVVVQFDVDIDSAILSASNSRELRITVDAGGIVRMCDPNTVAPDPRAC